MVSKSVGTSYNCIILSHTRCCVVIQVTQINSVAVLSVYFIISLQISTYQAVLRLVVPAFICVSQIFTISLHIQPAFILDPKLQS